jgi:hypothetical protein
VDSVSDVLRRTGAVALALLLASQAPADEEAHRPDGRRVSGTLSLDADNRLRFAPAGQASIPAEELSLIRFSRALPEPFRIAAPHRVLFRDGQQLTGQLLGLDSDALTLRTAWADRLGVPRAAVAALVQPPGYRTLIEDDFRDGTRGWATTGKPVTAEGDPPTLVLDQSGQSATCTLAAPLTAGRVGISFQEKGPVVGLRWQFEVRFQEGDKPPRPLSVTLAGPGEAYEVDAGGLEGTAVAVARSPGWHRLTVQFTPGSLRVTCDDTVLWYNLEQGPGGALCQVSLRCLAPKDNGKASGAVAFTAFSVARAVDEPPHPAGDPTQDEVWLADGDQLFGQVVRADRRTLDTKGRYGSRTLPWADLRGCFLRHDAAPPYTSDGAQVRLGLRSGLDAQPDLLDGVLKGLDERQLTLKHALFGDLRLERARVQEVRPLFSGRRIELDNGLHHLGEQGKAVARPGLPPRAEGAELRRTFTLAAVPEQARLTLTVVQLPGWGEGLRHDPEKGTFQTQVIVNDRCVDFLERLVDRATAEPRRLSIALPPRALRSGENVLLLRQVPDRQTQRYPHGGVAGLAIEVPR